jgi:filamentous hemagglutinin
MIRPLKIDQAQFGAKVGRHMREFRRNPANKHDRKWLEEHIQKIYTQPDEIRDGTFSGQGEVTESGANARGPVWFYAKGKDVVVTDKEDNFVTILKDGTIDSTSYKSATRLTYRP